jgi:hypothetical protein
MSIRDEINRQCEAGALYRVPGFDLDGAIRREVYVTENLRVLLAGPWEDQPHRNFGRRVAASVFAFMHEEYIAVRQGPPSDDDTQVARLEPPHHNVFELRCPSAGPSIRIFGRIAEKDVFVGMHWKYRNWLGRFRDPNWLAAIEECKSIWEQLFPSQEPLSGGQFPDDYLSGAIAP